MSQVKMGFSQKLRQGRNDHGFCQPVISLVGSTRTAVRAETIVHAPTVVDGGFTALLNEGIMEIDCWDVIFCHDFCCLIVQVHHATVSNGVTQNSTSKCKQQLGIGLSSLQFLRYVVQLLGVHIRKPSLPRHSAISQRPIVKAPVKHNDVRFQDISSRSTQEIVQALDSVCGLLSAAIPHIEW